MIDTLDETPPEGTLDETPPEGTLCSSCVGLLYKNPRLAVTRYYDYWVCQSCYQDLEYSDDMYGEN